MWSSEVSPQRRTAWCPGPETVTWHGKKDVADVVRRMTMTEGDGPGPGLTSQQDVLRTGPQQGRGQRRKREERQVRGAGSERERGGTGSGGRPLRGRPGNKPALGSDVRAPEP